MTAPSFYDIAAACLFAVGMVIGWVIRWMCEECRDR